MSGPSICLPLHMHSLYALKSEESLHLQESNSSTFVISLLHVLPQVSITVPPGQCIDLEIRSIPTTKEGFVPYYIPLDGAISVWLEDAIAVSPDSGNHFNWNIPVSDMVEIAEVWL